MLSDFTDDATKMADKRAGIYQQIGSCLVLVKLHGRLHT